MDNEKDTKENRGDDTGDKPSTEIIVTRRKGDKPWLFKPGQVANPMGRHNTAQSILDLVNIMGPWREAEVREVLESRNASIEAKAAARVLLAACSTKVSKSGVPIAGPELDRILDRVLGKAIARAHSIVETRIAFDPSLYSPDEMATLVELLGRQKLPQTDTAQTQVTVNNSQEQNHT